MVCLMLLSSVMVNCIVPIPAAMVLPLTTRSPIISAVRMDMNIPSMEQIWCVAQLSVLNKVGLFEK